MAALEPSAVVRQFWPAISRLARAAEVDAEARKDLEQDIVIALWRSLPSFAERCSLRTWVYRVAHNVVATHVGRAVKRKENLLALEELESHSAPVADERLAVAQLSAMIALLKPIDRALFVLYLEGFENQEIAEVIGIDDKHVAVKVHRIKALLREQFSDGGPS